MKTLNYKSRGLEKRRCLRSLLAINYKLCFLLIGVFHCEMATAVAENGGAGKLNAGGGSVDLGKSRTEQAVPQGVNLLKNSDFEDINTDINADLNQRQRPLDNWGGIFWVHDGEVSAKEKMLPLITRKISEDNPASGKRCAVFITPPEVSQFRDEAGKPEISNRIRQNVVVAENSEPAKYQLTFNSRGKLEKIPGLNSLRVFVDCFDGQEGPESKSIKTEEVGFPLTPAWKNDSVNLIAPAGTRLLVVSLALYGCGEAYLDDVELRIVQSE